MIKLEDSESVDLDDIELEYYRASGKGGQHRNKRDTAVRLKHNPSGIVVTCSGERSQAQNRKRALATLANRLSRLQEAAATASGNRARRSQIGTGYRGDKIRTYRERDNLVIDHRSGKKSQLSRLRKGDWSKV